MAERVCISVDAMGGDNAPSVVLEGVEQALAQDPDLEVALCGPEDVVVEFSNNHDRCRAVVCTEVVEMAEHPANAVRKKKDSSLVVGCRLVKEGEAAGFFSAGSTGACLAGATLVIGRIKGVSRPALCMPLPSPKPCLLTDVGANADCKPAYLLQFAQMASIYMERIMGVSNPRVALLNIGEEDTKGSSFAQETNALLREKLPNFKGNGEGRDLFTGEFDIFVTDGFTGNVCLKTIEGTSSTLFKMIKGELLSSTLTKLAALIIKPKLGGLKAKVSADTYGGAPLLGVKGAVIVGHGSSNATAIKNGVLYTAATARCHVSDVIAEKLAESAAEATIEPVKADETEAKQA